MMELRVEDYELYRQFKEIERQWKNRSAEIVEEMIEKGVNRIEDEMGRHFTLVVMPETVIKEHTRKSYTYLR